MSRSIWSVLGIKSTRDRDEIRRAYAKKLRVTNPEDDPEGFMALRQAYEAALARARQPVYEAVEAHANDASEEVPEPARDPGTDVPARDQAEIAFRTARTAEERQLHDHRDALLAALADDRVDAVALRGLFDAILNHPMMAEIAVRAGMEDWLAHVIAGHLPRADGLVGPAIAAFGWEDDSVTRRMAPAVHAVRERGAEIDFAAAAARPHAPLHLGWQALTAPVQSEARMRLATLLPGRPREVETILANADGGLPGIRDWFDAGAEAWWRRWFERERVTGELLVLPLMGVLAMLLLISLEAPFAGLLALAAGLAAPIAAVRLIKQPQRDWAENPWDRPAWQLEGWMATLPLLPLIAAFTPANGAGIAIIAVAALLVLGWTTIATPQPRDRPFWHRIGGIIQLTWPIAIFVMSARSALAPVRGIGLAIVTITLVIAWWRGGDAIAARLRSFWPGRRLQRLAPLILVVTAGAMIAGAVVAALPMPPRERIHTGMLAIVTGIILVYLADRVTEAGQRRWPVIVGWIAIVIFSVGIIGANADQSPTRTDRPGANRAERPPQPLTPIAEWVVGSDYPPGAMARGGDYVTAFDLAVDARGAITGCTIVKSSGSDVVDATTCRSLRQRGHFNPALDADARPVAGIYSGRLGWTSRTIASKARAVAPRGTTTGWVKASDYPPGTLDRAGRYVIGYDLAVAADGKVAGCVVTQSSGVPAIDAATCKSLQRRGGFTPALDAQGAPVASLYRGELAWTITTTAPAVAPVITCPADDRVARQPGIAFIAMACQPEAWVTTGDYPDAARRDAAEGSTGFRLAIDAEGRVSDCTVAQPSGSLELDDATCRIVGQRARFLPALDAAGNRVPGQYFNRIRWTLPPR